MRKYLLLAIISTMLAFSQNSQQRYFHYGNEMTSESFPDTIAKEIWNDYKTKYDNMQIDRIEFTWQDLKEGSFVHEIDVNDDSIFEYYIEAGAKDSTGTQILRSIGGNGDNYIYQKKDDRYIKICEFEGSTGWFGDNKTKGYWDIYGSIHVSAFSSLEIYCRWNGERYVREKFEMVMYWRDMRLTARQANNVGLELFNKEKYTEVIELWESAYRSLRSQEGWVELANNLGYTYLKICEHDKAIKVLNDVIRCDSSRALAYYNLAEVYEAMSDTNSAIENYEKYLTLDSLSKRAVNVREKLNLLEK